MSEQSIVIVFDDGEAERFNGDEEEARYWVQRRYERGRPADYAVIGRALPVGEWMAEIDRAEIEHHRQAEEKRERAEFERLKKKFGGSDG